MSRESFIEARAALFAADAHQGKRYGRHPYTYHLRAVRQVCDDFELDLTSCVVAWLHDTIEDTWVTTVNIVELFGNEVSRRVWALTGVGDTRTLRVQSWHAKLRACPEAAVVKLADRIANVEESAKTNQRLFAMYKAEQPSFNKLLCDTGTVEYRPEMVVRLSKAFDRSKPT
jgi:(p)ppGpp synthase/HD superfamily hydrolase